MLYVEVKVDYSEGVARYLQGMTRDYIDRFTKDLDSGDLRRITRRFGRLRKDLPSIRIRKTAIPDYGRVSNVVTATPTLRFHIYLQPEEGKIVEREEELCLI